MNQKDERDQARDDYKVKEDVSYPESTDESTDRDSIPMSEQMEIDITANDNKSEVKIVEDDIGDLDAALEEKPVVDDLIDAADQSNITPEEVKEFDDFVGMTLHGSEPVEHVDGTPIENASPTDTVTDPKVVEFIGIAPAPIPVTFNFNQISLDIETLARSGDSIVLSIGAVRFNLDDALEERDEIMNTPERLFYAKISIESSFALGRKIDPATLKFWFDQLVNNDSIKADLPYNGEEGFVSALTRLADFITPRLEKDDNVPYDELVKRVQVWTKDPSFDARIISDSYKSVNMDVPWMYFNNRDVRTAQDWGTQAAGFSTKVEPIIKHNALEDAVAQVLTVQNSYAMIVHRPATINVPDAVIAEARA